MIKSNICRNLLVLTIILSIINNLLNYNIFKPGTIGGSNVKINESYWGRRLCLILVIIIIAGFLPIQSVAEQREYKVEKYQEKINIPASSIKSIELNFQEGEELEFVFSLQIKEGLPIDVWFVNDDNYILFVNGGEFLFFIDGSAQQITFTRKIVTLTNYDVYKLIFANYNNQSLEVSNAYEIRTYYAESKDSSPDYLPIFLYSLIIAIVILAVLLAFLFVKNRKLKRNHELEKSEKVSGKKPKSRGKMKEKTKAVGTQKKPPSKRAASRKEKQKSRAPRTSTKKSKSKAAPDSATFCGNCGKPGSTLYCKFCGHKL